MLSTKKKFGILSTVNSIEFQPHVMALYPGSEHEFNISARNVRDEIIKSLTNKFGGNNLVKRIIEHMKKFGKYSIDNHSEFVIILTEFAHTRLVFKTTRVDGEMIDYFLNKYDLDPPEKFTKSSNWLRLFGY